MTQTETIIHAIKELKIDLLDLILNENNSYLYFPKDLFIRELSNKFEQLKKQGITKFNRLSNGTCQKCYKGCSGFTFSTKNNDYLDLIIEEKENKITNIFLYFKKDIRTSYVPTSLHLPQQRGIERAENEFKEFASWLRLAPNNKISGGKILSRHLPKGSSRLKRAFRLAANTIGNLKEGHLNDFLKRINYKKRRATARELAVIIWNMHSKGQDYNPPKEYLDQKRKLKLVNRIKKNIAKFEIKLQDVGFSKMLNISI